MLFTPIPCCRLTLQVFTCISANRVPVKRQSFAVWPPLSPALCGASSISTYSPRWNVALMQGFATRGLALTDRVIVHMPFGAPFQLSCECERFAILINRSWCWQVVPVAVAEEHRPRQVCRGARSCRRRIRQSLGWVCIDFPPCQVSKSFQELDAEPTPRRPR